MPAFFKHNDSSVAFVTYLYAASIHFVLICQTNQNLLNFYFIFQGDYRMDGRLELVVAATEGEIRGFMPSNPEARSKVFDLTAEQEAIRELTQKKQNLLLELKNYEENARLAPAGPGVLLAASKANATGK